MATVTRKIIEELDGNVSAIARKVKLSRTSVYEQIRKDPELVKALEDARESLLDDVESNLFKGAKSGNTTAQIFILKTLGKPRGYVERQEITGADGGPMNIELTWPEDDAEG